MLLTGDLTNEYYICCIFNEYLYNKFFAITRWPKPLRMMKEAGFFKATWLHLDHLC